MDSPAETPDERMSVVPYDNHRDVVLRHADSVVVFDPESRQMSLQSRSRDMEPRSPVRTECPTCGRPWHRDSSTSARDPSAPVSEEQPSFINHDYFRMLARSLPGSSENSGPPSPRQRSIRSSQPRIRSPAPVPPPNAEFVGSLPAPPSPAHGISETAFAPLYFEKFFVVERELGKGGRGVVLLVKHILDGVVLGHFACKRVPIGDDHAWLEKVLVEVQALQTLSHQNLVSYRHVWLEDYQLTNFGPSVPCAFILQQYCNGGDLHNYVCGSAKVSTTTQELKERIRRRSKGEAELPRKRNEPRKVPFEDIYSFFQDITAGLKFLHLHGFIHRDLKPSNCLLHTIGDETRVLVSDFGEVQYENATRKSTGATGTISYCAPEVLRRVAPDGPFGNFTFKSDIFSLGMILHFLCFANLPYRAANVLHEEKEDVNELRNEIMAWGGFDDQRRQRPDLPPRLYTFLKRLLSLSPDDRPTAGEVSHGVRLGGFDHVPEMRRRQSASPEELTPTRRIQKLDDSPARGNSPDRRPARHDGKAEHASSPLRRRTISREAQDAESDAQDSTDFAIDSEDEKADSSVSMERTLSAPLQTQTVVLRSKSSSRTSTPRLHPSPPPERRQQFLLPPPRPRRTPVAMRAQYLLRSDITSSTVRIALLAVKLFTALQPCISRGMNATILYPLLMIGILELTIFPLRIWKALAAMLMHVLILSYALSSDRLCRNERSIWTEG